MITQLLNNAKYIFMSPMNDWKAVSDVTKGVPGVYALINKVNGKVYIGSSVNLYNRLRDYYANWYIASNPGLLISKAINKYGLANIGIAILETTTLENTLKVEQHYLDTYKPEYNILKMAGRPTGYTHTEEGKAKIRAAHKISGTGHKVITTDTITGTQIPHLSLRAAAKHLKCRQTTVADLARSGELLRTRYLVQYSKSPTSPLV